MNRLLILSFAVFIALPCLAEEFLLRHKFAPGQLGRAVTDLEMQGDSYLSGEKAATQLRMRMVRAYRVEAVDTDRNAHMVVSVQRLRTEGQMEGTPLNQDLSGEELRQAMFGAQQIRVAVSPLGRVEGGEGPSFEQLGISVFGPLDETGGFEFPTFPPKPVRVGDSWDQFGRLIHKTQVQAGPDANHWIYRLNRIQKTDEGPVAVIVYRKTTDLSGMILGGVQVGGLVIQLRGVIEFNINRGVVIKAAQQGVWDLNMDISEQRRKTNLRQEGLRIGIKTRFRWSRTGRSQQREKPHKSQEPQIADSSEELRILPVPETKETP